MGDVSDGAGLEAACLDGQVCGVREDLQHPGGLGPVGGEVVFAAEQDVIDAGDAGGGRVELGLGHPQPGPQPVGALGLGEPRLYPLGGGLGEVEQPVPDHPLMDPVLRELQPQSLQCDPDRQHTARHQCSAFRPVAVANVKERESVPPGPRRSSSTVNASRLAWASRSAGMCRQDTAHGP